jgi:uncharacterized protein (DUF2062 family)
MPRQFFTRLSRRFRQNREHPWYLKPFEYLLAHPVYFSASRRSVSGSIALGLFVGLFPVPAQTAIALLGALLLRVNLPLAAVSVWITNPITFGPIFYMEYRIGAALLNKPTVAITDIADFTTRSDVLAASWQPLLYGATVVAIAVAATAYLAISAAWHFSTVQRYRRRHKAGQHPEN